MGSPQQPSAEQITILEKSGQLQLMEPPKRIIIRNGNLESMISMPSQAVSLLKLDWK
jgi:xylan 1,4-beta-xylosidase